MIEDKLKNKNAREKATVKGQEIAKIARKKHNRGAVRIEFVDIQPIEGGVEVFARAWKNGTQIGFGKDGTVDVERFRIINPPVLVPDPQGPIVRTWTDIDGNEITYRLREDPEEALLQVIEHNLSVMQNIYSDSKIVTGKVGRTTTTVYPDANPESTSVDGRIARDGNGSGTGTDWSADYVNWDGTSTGGGSISDTLTSGTITYNGFYTAEYKFGRSFFLFDTSSIGADTISSATISFYLTSIVNSTGNAATYGYANISSSNPASNTALAYTDVDSVGSTKLSSDFDYDNMTTSAYNDFVLNASGITNIDGSGVSKFATRGGHDWDNVAPTGNNSTSAMTGYYADQTGTTNDPKLVVEHTAAATAKKNLMTLGVS